MGTLVVRVKTGLGIYPVPEAAVTVVSEQRENSDVMYRGYTDKAGITEPILLPAGITEQTPPNDKGRLQPDTYSVEVQHEGFFDVMIYGIPVFPHITTDQTVYMTPKPSTDGNGDSGFDDVQHIGQLYEEDLADEQRQR